MSFIFVSMTLRLLENLDYVMFSEPYISTFGMTPWSAGGVWWEGDGGIGRH
jgi:hypothetical protein